jgi:glycosyltransferase involved in cell wall biosynthesis
MGALSQRVFDPQFSAFDTVTGAAVSRSSPCPCGSRKRFKSCCGAIAESESHALRTGSFNLPLIKARALAAQQSGRMTDAIADYEQVLLIDPADFDSAHMRAVALYQLGCSNEAASAFFALLRAGHRFTDSAWHNFGLAVAASVQWADDSALLERVQAYRRAVNTPRHTPSSRARTRVSVVIACYNHERFVEEAIASVAQQTRLPDELIVIDDGSSDGSVRAIERALASLPFQVEFRARNNRGAATTFNEAIDLASGDLILPLNSDDRFDSHRIKHIIKNPSISQLDWGFGGVSYILADGSLSPNATNTRTYALRAVGNAPFMAATTGLSFLLANPAISTGNLFFRKSLWSRVGGFFDWRYHHDWFFALQAAKFSEPVHLPHARYDYRVHESNTIAEQRDRVQNECKAMMGRALADLCVFTPAAEDNAFAPCPAVWKRAFFATVGGVGFMEQLPHDALVAFANEMEVGAVR